MKKEENEEEKENGEINEEEGRASNNLGEEGVDNPETKETEKEDEGLIKKENKQLNKIFLVLGICVLFFLGIFLFINSIRHFTYEEVDFEVVKEGELILYRTSVPVNAQKTITTKAIFGDYSFYLRNDPRKLKNIPLDIEGEFTLMRNAVINFTGDFNCDGDGIIAVANLINVLRVLDVETIQDETAGCDPDGRYTFLQIQVGEETSIEQFGPSCYNLNINDCEVLEVTEKYIVELLSEVNKNVL